MGLPSLPCLKEPRIPENPERGAIRLLVSLDEVGIAAMSTDFEFRS